MLIIWWGQEWREQTTYTIPIEIIVEGFGFQHPRQLSLWIRNTTSTRRAQPNQNKPRDTSRARIPSSIASGSVTIRFLCQHRLRLWLPSSKCQKKARNLSASGSGEFYPRQSNLVMVVYLYSDGLQFFYMLPDNRFKQLPCSHHTFTFCRCIFAFCRCIFSVYFLRFFFKCIIAYIRCGGAALKKIAGKGSHFSTNQNFPNHVLPS